MNIMAKTSNILLYPDLAFPNQSLHYHSLAAQKWSDLFSFIQQILSHLFSSYVTSKLIDAFNQYFHYILPMHMPCACAHVYKSLEFNLMKSEMKYRCFRDVHRTLELIVCNNGHMIYLHKQSPKMLHSSCLLDYSSHHCSSLASQANIEKGTCFVFLE